MATTTTGIFLSAHLDRAKETVKRTDHTHLAFMRNSFTQARITDSHGQWTSSGRISVQWDGDIRWQSRATSSRRAAALCYTMLEVGGAFPLENARDSFVWEHPAIRKILKKADVNTILLNQCAYGAESVKPTAIASNAEWILTGKLTRKDVPPHSHIQHGLTGKVFDPNVGE